MDRDIHLRKGSDYLWAAILKQFEIVEPRGNESRTRDGVLASAVAEDERTQDSLSVQITHPAVRYQRQQTGVFQRRRAVPHAQEIALI